MPLAAVAARKMPPAEDLLVTSVFQVLAGENMQTFTLGDLMKRLRAPRADAFM